MVDIRIFGNLLGSLGDLTVDAIMNGIVILILYIYILKIFGYIMDPKTR